MSTQRRGHWIVVLALLTGMTDRAGAAESETDVAAALHTRLKEQRERLAELQATARAQDRTLTAIRIQDLREQIRDVLSEPAFRKSLMADSLQAGYDDGFFIRSHDEKFSLRINGRVQARYTYYNSGSRNRYLLRGFRRSDRSGFDLRRVRWTLRGDLYDKTLTWYLQLRGDGTDSYNVRVLDAHVNYKVAEVLQFQAGIFKAAALQTRLTSSSRLQFVERPLFDSIFGYDRGAGLRIWGRACEKRLEYYLDILNSLGSATNRTITPDPPELDGNPAVVARAVWYLLGDAADLKAEAALRNHVEPAWDIAFHYAFNDDDGDQRTADLPFSTTRFHTVPGSFGLTSTRGVQINQFGLSSRFKVRCFSLRGEYVVRLVDPQDTTKMPLTPWFQLTGDDSTTAQHGGYIQAGWFPPIPQLDNKLEVVGRVGGYAFHAAEADNAWEYALGINYYFEGNKVKLQADVTKVTEAAVSSGGSSIANVNDQPLVFRVQLQAGF
jgi:hypothetical protein